jgi:hypothetical protein
MTAGQLNKMENPEGDVDVLESGREVASESGYDNEEIKEKVDETLGKTAVPETNEAMVFEEAKIKEDIEKAYKNVEALTEETSPESLEITGNPLDELTKISEEVAKARKNAKGVRGFFGGEGTLEFLEKGAGMLLKDPKKMARYERALNKSNKQAIKYLEQIGNANPYIDVDEEGNLTDKAVNSSSSTQ